MGSADGCFATKAISNTQNGVAYSTTEAWNTSNDGISFLASRSSSIFGKSTKVQTRSYQLLMIIKAWYAAGWTFWLEPKIGLLELKFKDIYLNNILPEPNPILSVTVVWGLLKAPSEYEVFDIKLYVLPMPFGVFPNVQGQAVGSRGAETSYSGSLTLTQTGTCDYLGAQLGGVLTLNIDASKNSSIYKNTSKINVRSYQALIIIKA